MTTKLWLRVLFVSCDQLLLSFRLIGVQTKAFLRILKWIGHLKSNQRRPKWSARSCPKQCETDDKSTKKGAASVSKVRTHKRGVAHRSAPAQPDRRNKKLCTQNGEDQVKSKGETMKSQFLTEDYFFYPPPAILATHPFCSPQSLVLMFINQLVKWFACKRAERRLSQSDNFLCPTSTACDEPETHN